MKIVSWNINSVRARLDALLAWLQNHQPDVLCLQETKVNDPEFPTLEFKALGYNLEAYGQKSYNGVAILSRANQRDVSRGFDGSPDDDKRVIAATIDGIRVINLYVPNGKSVGTEQYDHKLAWLDAFLAALRANHQPTEPLLICGDLNIAPEDRDTYDPDVWRGRILCSVPERERFRSLLDWGLTDALRSVNQSETFYTWWDYRMGGFRRNLGLRIDHFLITQPVAARLADVTVDREARAGVKPSDHAPLILTLDD